MKSHTLDSRVHVHIKFDIIQFFVHKKARNSKSLGQALNRPKEVTFILFSKHESPKVKLLS